MYNLSEEDQAALLSNAAVVVRGLEKTDKKKEIK